jgi:hypothetical protein
VSIVARPSHLYVPFSEKLDSLLDHLDNWCTMYGSQNDALEWGARELKRCPLATRRFTIYKYLFRLALITISHFFFLSRIGFTFLTFCSQSMENKRGTKRACSPSKEGTPSLDGAKTPSLTPFGSPPSLTSLPEVSSRCPRSPMWE